MGYVACLGQIPEETAHVLQNLVSANGLTLNDSNACMHACIKKKTIHRTVYVEQTERWFCPARVKHWFCPTRVKPGFYPG